jgi:ankyrin repeat protein
MAVMQITAYSQSHITTYSQSTNPPIFSMLADVDLAKAKAIIEADPKAVNARDNKAASPLHLAAELCNQQMVELLLSKGADVNARDDDGETPLFRPIIGGPMISTLSGPFSGTLSAPKQINTPLQVVILLLSKGADADAEANDGETPLQWAAGRGDTEIVELLLKKGAKPNHFDKYGRTPLHNAAFSDNAAVTTLLLKNGADCGLQSMKGIAPLHQAVATDNIDVVKILLAAGCNPEIKDKKGHSPLQWAAALGLTNSLSILLSKGCDPNSTDSDGKTALHWAGEEGQQDVVEMLLNKGASITTKDNNGKTPVEEAELAAGWGRSEFTHSIDISFLGISTMSYRISESKDHKAAIELLRTKSGQK